VKVLDLGYEVVDSHGKDLRDWVNTPHSFVELVGILDGTAAWQPPESHPVAAAGSGPAGAGGEKTKPSVQKIATFTEAEIIKALQADVLGVDQRGQIKVYSEFHHRTTLLVDPAKLKFENLLAAFGPIVKSVVSRNNEENAPGMHPIREVREALSLLAGYRLLSDDTELGAGIWPCHDTTAPGSDTAAPSAIVLVGPSEAAHYNGKWERVIHPLHQGNLLAFDTGSKPWYDFDRLGAMIQQAADVQWRRRVVDDMHALWSRWRWRGSHDPTILTGLVMATWIQSLWAWRPRVDILGASNTGKSMFCSALAGVFQNLCLCTSDTTAAGLRQEICNQMKAVVVDEVDAQGESKKKEQLKILEMIRSASRGTVSIRGSGSQKSIKFTLRHIVWAAGITLPDRNQADRNRAIRLELLPPTVEKAGKLTLPTPAELADLGQRTLAVALWSAQEACKLAVALKDTKVPEMPTIDPRQIESYSVPASILWVAMALEKCEPRDMLVSMLESAKIEGAAGDSDEQDLIGAILQAQIRDSHGTVLNIGQIIERLHDQTVNIDVKKAWRELLAQYGVKIDIFGYSDGVPKEIHNEPALLLNYKIIKSIPLKGTPWHDQPIEQILRRIPGAYRAKRRVGGLHGKVVMLPLTEFRKNFIGQECESQETLGPGDF
jgi:hypothetical protein